MKKIILHIIICLAFASQSLAQISVDNGYISNQLYVKIIPPTAQSAEVQYIPHPDNPNMGKSAWDVIKNYGGMSMINAFSTNFEELKNVYKVTLKQGADIEGLVNALNLNQDVEFAERIPVYSIEAKPFDLDESKQWYFKTINMNSSWELRPDINLSKTVAVIDNGVQHDHEDLRSKIAENRNEIAGDGVDNDGNGYVDDYYGWNVAEGNSDPSPHTIDNAYRNDPRFATFGWHGTHVSGIIGAGADNQVGIASLGVNNRILGIKAAGVIGGRPNDIILFNIDAAFTYAIERNVDIINCSFGSTKKSIVSQAKINEAISKGIIVIAAAGNSNSATPTYPAAYEGVIAVGATNRDDEVWRQSNYGSNYGNYIDVMAPGHDIYSTVSTDNGSYGYLSGTSMAAPIVTGLAGLILSMEPDRVNQIEEIIKGGCDNIDDKNPNYINKIGAGRINVDKSFDYLLHIDDPLSVVSVTKYTDFNVYPNPAPKQFFIPFNTISQDGQAVTVIVYNAVGAEVAKQQISYQSQPISVGQLAQGMYHIAVTNSQGKNFRTRLMVNY